MFFRKKKKSYGNTGQVSSNYTPNYMQPMPNQQTAPSWGVAPAAPPLSHYGAAGLQPPVYHDAGAIGGGAGGAYAAPPALPSRPPATTRKPLPTPPGHRAPSQCPPPLPTSLGSSHSAACHAPPPQHHHQHYYGGGGDGLGSSHSAVVGSHNYGGGLGHHDAAYTTYQQPA